MRSDMGKTTVTQDEASFQDDGLWRKLLTRAQKGTANHGFFVIDVVQGCMHTSMFCKLGLPTLFMHNHCKNLNEHIILEGPDGHQWPTLLGFQLDSQPCLMHGWKEFAADYNLQIKDQVVFLLFDYSHFLVQVYDVNNKVKNRVLAAPEKVNNANSDMKVKSVSQAGTHAHHSDLPSMHGFKTSSKENIIHILDSSEEEEEDDQAPVKHSNRDASKIGGSSSKMTLRSAKKLEKVDTEDHTLNDVSNRMKSSGVFEKQAQEHVQSDDETDKIMDRILRKNNSSPEHSAMISAPSSPEHIMVLKRSRRLQRKSGDYEGDDLGRATSVVRSGNLYKLSQELEKVPPRLYEDAKEPAVVRLVTRDALKRVPGSEILTSCCSTQQSTMRRQQRHFQQLQESTSKITEAPAKLTVLNTNIETESVPELAAPETPGGRPVVKARHKVKVSRDRGKKRIEKPCPSEEEANKKPARVGVPVKALNLFYVSRRRPVTAQERQKTLEAAQAYAKKSTKKHYVMQLRTSQVYCGFHLGVQPEFVEAMQLPSTRLKVMLYDTSDKIWEVEWLGDHPKRPGLHSAGWTQFVLENYLEEGDVCVFEKSTVVNNMISVKIFPIVPLVALPERGWKSHYILPDDGRTVAYHEFPDQSQC